ncbi:substrate-binding domain-containing protein [Actinocatenispora sera]|uniref:substrate-binding domain-containing protein n=1 Tax=Actinocatenispora sera TaxID=390989 RepID=UPI0033E01571
MTRRVRAGAVLAAVALGVVALLTGCGSPGSGTGGSSGGSGTDDSGATVTVLYAGSLVNLMEHDVKPAFEAASGDTFRGEGKGSDALVNEIKGKVTRADVFVSASTASNDKLRGSGNGDWESWYATFATAPLVLGYNPKSRFAAQLKSKPWQQVVVEPGFRLGRTDPKLDPKGRLSAQALTKMGLGKFADTDAGVFPEETLLGRLQAGQLDAGFFYTSEATEAKVPTISLAPVELGATYTVTVLNRGPQPAAAAAFVKYLLGPKGVALMRKHGLHPAATVTLTGDRSAVPATLRSAVGGS